MPPGRFAEYVQEQDVSAIAWEKSTSRCDVRGWLASSKSIV
jgi:hypothetical protein